MITAFANLKGGTGKTSICFGIAGELGARGKKVLVIDADAQSDMSQNFGITRVPGLPDVLEKNISPAEVIKKTEIENVSLIPSSFSLFETALLIVSRPAREYILGKWIAKNGLIDDFDEILIDTAPGCDLTTQNALAVADSIALVTDQDINSLEGCLKLREIWGNISAQLDLPENFAAIVVNNMIRNTNFGASFQEALEANPWTRELVCKTHVPSTVKVKEATSLGTPVTLYSDSSASRAIKDLVDELIEREVFA